MNPIYRFVLSCLLVLPVTLAKGAPVVVTGPGEGHAPRVNRLHVNLGAGNDTLSFLAYPKNFAGGVRVALGDVNGDGRFDIVTGPGPGAPARIQIFDAETGREWRGKAGQFHAFGGDYRGGVFVAAGDVNGDGRDDIVTGADQGAPPAVRVFDGATGAVIHSFFAFDPSFRGGVRVAAGDIDGDGRAEIIVGAGPGGLPEVRIFGLDGSMLRSSILPSDESPSRGVFVATGDVNNDGFADMVAGLGGSGGRVQVRDGLSNTILADFLAYRESDFNFASLTVAAGDLDGDGRAEALVAGTFGRGTWVRVFSLQQESPPVDVDLLGAFQPYGPNYNSILYVAGDGGIF